MLVAVLQPHRPYQPPSEAVPHPRPHAQAQQLPRDPWDPSADQPAKPPTGPPQGAPGPPRPASQTPWAPEVGNQQPNLEQSQASQQQRGPMGNPQGPRPQHQRAHQPYMPHLAEQNRAAQHAGPQQPQRSMQKPQEGMQTPSQGPNTSSAIMQAVQGLESHSSRQEGQPNRAPRHGNAQDQARNQRQPQQEDVDQRQNSERGPRSGPPSALPQPAQQQQHQQQQGQNRQGQGRTLPLPARLPQPASQGPPAGLQVSRGSCCVTLHLLLLVCSSS